MAGVEKTDKKIFAKLSDKEEQIASGIIDAVYSVHKNLGPGLLEKIYETCFCYELSKRGLLHQRQVNVPIKYETMMFDEGLRLDVLVENTVICELKAAEHNPLWEAQLLSYLKLTGKRLGLLINFNTPLAKQGIKRIIL